MKLPLTWSTAHLEDVCDILDSKRIPVNNTDRNQRIAGKNENKLFPYYGATGQVGVIDDFIFEGQHVLVGEDGAPFLDPVKNKAYVATGKFWVNNHAHILKSKFSNNFLCYFLNQFNYSGFVTGTTRLKLNQTALKIIPVVVPPLNEQKRIVAKIEELFSELDNGVSSLKAAREQLKVYRQAVLKNAFEGKLTTRWRKDNADKLALPEQLLARIQKERETRYQQQLGDWKEAVRSWEEKGKEGKKPTKPSENKKATQALVDHINIPGQWASISVGELNIDVFDGPFGSSLKTSDYVEAGTRVIRLENIGEMEFVEDKYSFISEEKFETLKKHSVHGGDIIFASFITEGIRVVILPSMLARAINKADCFCIRSFGNSYNARFLAWYLSSRVAFKQIEPKVHGVGRPRINTSQLKSFVVPVCSMSEQDEILQTIDSQFLEIDVITKDIDTQLLRSETLRQSILKKAFSGQLVPQNPNDEPASELLARIKAEREAEKISNSRKKPSARHGQNSRKANA